MSQPPYKIKEERDKLDPVTREVMLDQDGMPQTEEVEIKIPAFRAVSVFGVSQTDGEPIPELEAKELLSTVEVVEALSAMNDDDRLSIAAYLESRGAWTMEIANEGTKEFGEYHLDVRYNTDTNEIIDVKAEVEKNKAEREAQLLHGDTYKYGIYQLKDDPELRDFHFAGTTELLKRGILSDDFREIQPENYSLVYIGELSDIRGKAQGEKLNAIYEKFNIDHPADYRGHSLSVSDIVMLHENGENSAHLIIFYF